MSPALTPPPMTPNSGKKRTYTRKVKVETPPVPTGGFTTRLPGPVNVTVQANQHPPNTNSRGTYLASLRDPVQDLGYDKFKKLEDIRELDVFNDDEMGWLESLGDPMNPDITHPSFALLFQDTLTRSNISVEEFTNILPVLPSNTDTYFQNLLMASVYEVMNKFEEELAAQMEANTVNPNLSQNESDPNSRSSSPLIIKTLLKTEKDDVETIAQPNSTTVKMPGAKPNVELSAAALQQIRTIADFELLLFMSRGGKKTGLEFKSLAKAQQFMKIGNRALAEVIGVEMGTYVQQSDVVGHADSSVDYLALLSALIQSGDLPSSSMKDQCGIETSLTLSDTGSTEAFDQPPRAKKRKSGFKLFTIEPRQELTIPKDCFRPIVRNPNSAEEEKTNSADGSLTELEDSKPSAPKSPFEIEHMPRLCRVEDLWDFECTPGADIQPL